MIQVLGKKETPEINELIAKLQELANLQLDTIEGGRNWQTSVNQLLIKPEFIDSVKVLCRTDVYAKELGDRFHEHGLIEAITPVRRLRTILNMSLGIVLFELRKVVAAFDQGKAKAWSTLAEMVVDSDLGDIRILDYYKGKEQTSEEFCALAEELEHTDPHAIYPTSCYREGKGHVVSSSDDQRVEAVMSSHTFTSIKVTENVLSIDDSTLRDIYKPLERCVALVDTNVEKHFGNEIEAYFAAHGIPLEKLVYRAMEVDKGIQTVEQMLGDFKRLGVSRAEPILIAGGGVLCDTGGLACALYHRNTPYVMLSTSIVAGIDAGPSPRTCCDGFGYKNLFGAYHAPILSITDRTFFKTLETGWIRHGIAEIIKMSTVKDIELFEQLEEAGARLIETRFGTINCDADDPIVSASQRIIGGAIRSYVEAEYDNLYETHQCRAHAYGHTWSPGFEIQAGMLHGHAISVGMGFGAFVSFKQGWISEAEMHRVLRLISSFELSLWHDILLDKDVVWAAQVKMVEKRGGNLAAPLPKNGIGQCGYLNTMTRESFFLLIDRYKEICQSYPREGIGIEPLCTDVGLEDPSTVAESTLLTAN
ncbi:MAG: sedoheptulose 7-phosphate cyclase [Verrucomicrobiota bacterium]